MLFTIIATNTLYYYYYYKVKTLIALKVKNTLSNKVNYIISYTLKRGAYK